MPRRTTSVVRLPDHWYVACRSAELRGGPIARTILDTPVVLFRGRAGRIGAFLDRCPHRNVPLSLGRVLANGRLQCRYHGWEFEPDGACREIPGLTKDPGARRAEALPVLERDDHVWVVPRPGPRPATGPFSLAPPASSGYTVVQRTAVVEAGLVATLENALDVPHTAYLHRGLFRGGEKKRLEVVVRREADRVEAEYIGEPRPEGIAARILAPRGGEVEHWDRFILPSVAQVEYRLGAENHFLISAAMTPVSDRRTRIFASIAFRLRTLPGRLIRPILEPFAWKVFRQDRWILAHQTETIRRFGGERYASTEIDVLGPSILRLLRRAERGEIDRAAKPVVRRFELLA